MVDIFHYPFPLYRLFFCPANRVWGHNAELLIDHAWGWEPCTIADIKAYKPEASSVGSGQVLECPYDFVRTRLVVREMADQLALSLVESRLVTRQIVLTVGYDIENLTDETRSKAYCGEVKVDRYGRKIPKHAHGTANLPRYTSSSVQLMDAVTELFERIADENLLVRRLNLTACALPGFVDSKNEEKTERNAGYLVVSHSGGGMLRQGTRKGIRRTPANRGMRAHWVVKGLDISEDVCHGMCP